VSDGNTLVHANFNNHEFRAQKMSIHFFSSAVTFLNTMNELTAMDYADTQLRNLKD
jgi:hypothetical protein